jgi:dihydroorotate dehydrogenase
MNSVKAACNITFAKKIIQKNFACADVSLQKNVFGLHFRNPVGLGAGFDKNALYLRELEALGFGFVEIGTVTPKPQPGNDKPRLFRLPKDRALINRMGFNNDGAVAIQKRLEAWKAQQVQDAAGKFIVGGNIGKNKITLNEDAWKDYETCFKTLFDVVDYFVVNVSSPNTPGLRELQEKDALKKILSHLQDLNKGFSKQKPLLLKIAPDLSASQLDDIISLAFEIDLDGIVATNTTIGRNDLLTPASAIETIGAGGLSGKPLQQRSTQVLQYLVNSFENKIPVIASGGIFDGADAKEKLLAGASLVQVWTGFIYEGPAIAKEINQSLLQ